MNGTIVPPDHAVFTVEIGARSQAARDFGANAPTVVGMNEIFHGTAVAK